jgi:hypothetical protein
MVQPTKNVADKGQRPQSKVQWGPTAAKANASGTEIGWLSAKFSFKTSQNHKQ